MPFDNQSELFYLVDELDNVLGSVTRREAHADPKKIHRGVFIIVKNPEKQILFQKRSQYKDTHPGFWNLSSSGHVTFGQTYEDAASREMLEEIGLSAPLQFVDKFFISESNEAEIDAVFEAQVENPNFQLDPTEVDEVKWVYENQLTDFIHANLVSSAVIFVLQKLKYI